MSNKLTYECVKGYFKENGCELLEKKYKKVKTKIKYKCSCGNVSKIRFSDFMRGRRCRKCGAEKNAKKFSFNYEFVKNYFKEQGCEMLDDNYKNARTHINYRCSCGNISKIVFDSFKRGNRCQKCAGEKRGKQQTLTFDYVYNYFKKYNCEMLDKFYINSRVKIKYRCSCGNISYVVFQNFKRKKRCSLCGLKSRSGKNNYQWIEDREAHEEKKKFKQKCYKILRYTLKRTCQLKTDRTHEMLGYTYKDLKEHIYKHPNWEKVKNTRYHLDHIFPVQAFLNYGIKDLRLINCLENLRPLSCRENMEKGDRYNKEEFEKWLKGKKYEF